MTSWAAFAGLTVIVVSLLLVLAHLSQTLVSDSAAASHDTDARRGSLGATTSVRRSATDPVIPRLERPAEQHRSGGDVRHPELSTSALLANVALTQGVFGGLLLAGAFYFQIPPVEFGVDGTGLSTGALGVVVGVAFGVVLWLANEAAGRVADATGSGYDESLRELLAPDSLGGWVLLLGVVLPTIAFVEEFIFRAAAIGAVSAGFGVSPWFLAVVSSLAFGVAHGAQGRTGVVVTGALGFALAAAFVLTGSLLVVVVAHYLVNALELVVHEGLPLGSGSEHV